jgi:hypothetical protein
MGDKVTSEQFCGIKSIEKRLWFVIEQKFRGQSHTVQEWVKLVTGIGIEVKA